LYKSKVERGPSKKGDENKVKCPLFFITAREDRVCPPELVENIAKKYNAEYRVYDGCHLNFLV